MPTRNIKWSVLVLAALIFALPALAQDKSVTRQCSSVGGTMATNLAVIGKSTTMGTATGDLKGAVAATILKVTQNSDGTASFTVQHYFVSESGDTITFARATAMTMPLSATRFAIIDYPVHINGGTGKYANATADLDSIGEVDLASGQTVFRYTGKLCLAVGE
jgi:hypothetical protein